MSRTVVRRFAAVAALCIGFASASLVGGLQQAHAATSFQVQTMDSCKQAIGGATFELRMGSSGSGTMVGSTQTAPAGGPTTVAGPSGCPLQRGNCFTVPAGCVTFPMPADGTYTIDEVTPPANYAACNGGSACAFATPINLVQFASVTVSGQTVSAFVTNNPPDGSPSTMSPTGGTFSGIATDPIVFHNFGFGPGICDGDNDYDDQLTGSPGSHCDGTGSGAEAGGTDGGSKNLTIAAPSGGLIASGTSFAPLKPLLNPGGGTGSSVAVIAGAGANPPMEVGNVSGNLDAAVEGGGWQVLASPGCMDAPAAYHNHADGLLYVACQTAGGLQFGTGPMTATASGVPTLTGMQTLDGAGLPGGVGLLALGPAIASMPSGGVVAIFAQGTDFIVYGRAITGGVPGASWVATGAGTGCHFAMHIAATLGNGGALTYLACTRSSDQAALLLATASGSSLSGFSGFSAGPAPTGPDAGDPRTPPPGGAQCSLALGAGAIVDGPGAAGTPNGAILTMKGSNNGMYEQAVVGNLSSLSTPQEYGPNYGGNCGNGHPEPSPSISSGPGAASWIGTAVFLTVSPSSIPAGTSGTVNVSVLDSQGQPSNTGSVALTAPNGSGITFNPSTVPISAGHGSSMISVGGKVTPATVLITGTSSGNKGLALVRVGVAPPPPGWNGPFPLGGAGNGSGPARPVSWGPGNEDVFWKGADGNLWHVWYNNGWFGPQSLGGGPLGSDPHPLSTGLGRIDVYWTGTDGNLYQLHYTNGWHGPTNLGGGPLGSEPYPVNASGKTHVMWKGTDANLYEMVFDHGWHGPFGRGSGPLGSDPQPVVTGTGVIDVFWKGTDINLWHSWDVGGVWYGPGTLGSGPLGSMPHPVATGGSVIDVFWRGTDNNVWHTWYFGGWNGPQRLGGGGTMASDPYPVVFAPGAVDVFWKGNDSNLWHIFYDQGWTPPQNLFGGPLGTDPRPLAPQSGLTEVFWRIADNTVVHEYYSG